MKKLFLAIFTTVLLTQAFGQIMPNGTFVGLEKMKGYSDPSIPKYTWFHLSELTFKRDSVFLEQLPVAIYKNDTIFSASDGGFYSYKGTLQIYKGKTIASLTLINCDYCPMQMIRFTPPKIVSDNDTTSKTVVDTSSNVDEPKEIENPKLKSKTLFIEKTAKSNTILVDRNIYRRQTK